MRKVVRKSIARAFSSMPVNSHIHSSSPTCSAASTPANPAITSSKLPMASAALPAAHFSRTFTSCSCRTLTFRRLRMPHTVHRPTAWRGPWRRCQASRAPGSSLERRQSHCKFKPCALKFSIRYAWHIGATRYCDFLLTSTTGGSTLSIPRAFGSRPPSRGR